MSVSDHIKASVQGVKERTVFNKARRQVMASTRPAQREGAAIHLFIDRVCERVDVSTKWVNLRPMGVRGHI